MIEEDINLALLIIGAFLVVFGIAYYWSRRLYISKSTITNNSLTHLHRNRINECENCGLHYDNQAWTDCPDCIGGE